MIRVREENAVMRSNLWGNGIILTRGWLGLDLYIFDSILFVWEINNSSLYNIYGTWFLNCPEWLHCSSEAAQGLISVADNRTGSEREPG